MQALLDDRAHGRDARPGANAYKWDRMVFGKDDEPLLQANLQLVARLEREEPGGADAAAGELEHSAVVDDGDAEVDTAGVGAGGARDRELARTEGREEVEDVGAGDVHGAKLGEDLVDAPVRLLAVFVEVVLEGCLVAGRIEREG